MKTAQQAAANWVGSAGRAASDWQAGVNNYNGDWAGATTRQQGVMQTNWDQAVANGSWAAGVQRVGTSGWKAATTARASNYTTGFQAGAQNQAAAINKIMAELATLVPNLPARGTFEQNKIRSTTLMDALHARKGTLGAR